MVQILFNYRQTTFIERKERYIKIRRNYIIMDIYALVLYLLKFLKIHSIDLYYPCIDKTKLLTSGNIAFHHQ